MARVKRYILLQPFFSGPSARSRRPAGLKTASSALEKTAISVLAPVVAGAGHDRDDPLANPVRSPGPAWGEAEVGPMLWWAGGRDLLRDRDVEYGEEAEGVREESGVTVERGAEEEWGLGAEDGAVAEELENPAAVLDHVRGTRGVGGGGHGRLPAVLTQAVTESNSLQQYKTEL
ncbi:uncharacterized protein A4U43_C07F33490 [Asparagus officinalis]|uniref:Alpha/beta hydrolase fold-3 domain-containing protein n=1 Tax=Asparagus officinalis TaxID=4686 RepID=A0A5P1EJW7_ASPOF|nr:uncharacterized protein A4U43_C07F33490 [Asparagus officinalis]